VLAAQADARWAAKPSYLDAPGRARGQPLPALGLRDPGAYAREQAVRDGRVERPGKEVKGMERVPKRGVPVPEPEVAEPEIRLQTPDGERHQFTRGKGPPRQPKEMKDDPWKRARGAPSEEWQPQTWDPNSLPARR
jgi:NADH dehydrogenase [ubiquinone] 1 alpha subcomplex assembly factor 2